MGKHSVMSKVLLCKADLSITRNVYCRLYRYVNVDPGTVHIEIKSNSSGANPTSPQILYCMQYEGLNYFHKSPVPYIRHIGFVLLYRMAVLELEVAWMVG
jgi:hypothetical protein